MSEIDHLKRAETSFASAKLLLDNADYNGAVDRAYYAMHSAALHLFTDQGITIPKTHHGTHTLFHQYFVQNGRIAKERGADLSIVENTRLAADYSGEFISENRAKEAIVSAEEFAESD
jgi:uncharacterized protein (UPF0332 family)